MQDFIPSYLGWIAICSVEIELPFFGFTFGPGTSTCLGSNVECAKRAVNEEL